MLFSDFAKMDNDFVGLCNEMEKFMKATMSLMVISKNEKERETFLLILEGFEKKIEGKKNYYIINRLGTKISQELDESNQHQILPSYENILAYISQINDVFSCLIFVMRDTLVYKKRYLKGGFVHAYFNRSGLEISPEFLKSGKESRSSEEVLAMI